MQHCEVYDNSEIQDPSNYEFSVSQISKIIKNILEENLNNITIRGEISGLKIATSGHAYFNLKENTDIIACTCWRPVLAKLNMQIVEGMQVFAKGKITSYAGQSKYQFSVERMTPDGIGIWMQMLNARKEKLAKEGLFDDSRKKNLPFLPKVIGVVTSISGAVIQDIIHRISDRFPSRVIVWPVAVQGDNSANEVATAIKGFNVVDKINKPDVIIIARGGGSIEDLWSFNEEIVVRAIAESVIPVISAVGHETDYTLADFAADVRAPTPTAAAEIAVPVLSGLHATLMSYYNRVIIGTKHLIKHQENLIISYSRLLQQPLGQIYLKQQRLDELGFRLGDAPYNLLKMKANLIARFSVDNNIINKSLQYQELRLGNLYEKLNSVINSYLVKITHNLLLQNNLLNSLNYKSILKRGFAVIHSPDNKVISSALGVQKLHEFTIEFYDGKVNYRR